MIEHRSEAGMVGAILELLSAHGIAPASLRAIPEASGERASLNLELWIARQELEALSGALRSVPGVLYVVGVARLQEGRL